MASLLRQIVAGPRARHPDADLDLCYVTDNIIVTSGPAQKYPSLAYRNPLPVLVKFLDERHGPHWAIWEFRAEGTGYADNEVYHRIWHYPWPDHHPPPWALVPRVLAGMREWLHGRVHKGEALAQGMVETTDQPGETQHEDTATQENKRVVVVHCKAGKGRSGTMTVAYLMAWEGWSREEALQRFTERRMRPGFGPGVSIPSQLRWLDYTERWVKAKRPEYREQKLEVLEVHVWGLRDSVKLAIGGYVNGGKKIEILHTLSNDERDDAEERKARTEKKFATNWQEAVKMAVHTPLGKALSSRSPSRTRLPEAKVESSLENEMDPIPSSTAGSLKTTVTDPSKLHTTDNSSSEPTKPVASIPVSPADSKPPEPILNKTSSTGSVITNVIFRPRHPVAVPTNDINLSLERRSRGVQGWTMITAVAHVWFNCYFEGRGPEKAPEPPDTSGVFEITWDAMDGLKGSKRKGSKAFDRIAIVWRVAGADVPETIQSASAPVTGHGDILETSDGHLLPGKSPLDDTRVKRGSESREESDQDASRSDDDQAAKELETLENEGEVSSDEDGTEGLHRGVVGPPSSSNDVQSSPK